MSTLTAQSDVHAQTGSLPSRTLRCVPSHGSNATPVGLASLRIPSLCIQLIFGNMGLPSRVTRLLEEYIAGFRG